MDVKRIAELRRLEATADVLEVGAAMTHREVERAAVVRERWPALAMMERHVGNLRVRVMGTIGGNLCFADPHSDPATFLLATGGSLVCRRGDGPARELSIADFVKGPYQTALETGELVTSVRVPHPGPGAGVAHEKMSLHERPAVTVTCLARVQDGVVASARVAVGSVGNRPGRALDAEDALAGAAVDELDSRCDRRRGGGRGRRGAGRGREWLRRVQAPARARARDALRADRRRAGPLRLSDARSRLVAELLALSAHDAPSAEPEASAGAVAWLETRLSELERRAHPP